MISNPWACILRECEGRREKLILRAPCSGAPPFHWGPGLCHAFPSPSAHWLLCSPLFWDSELPCQSHVPSNSIILAVGKRIEHRAKQMEGNDSLTKEHWLTSRSLPPLRERSLWIANSLHRAVPWYFCGVGIQPHPSSPKPVHCFPHFFLVLSQEL